MDKNLYSELKKEGYSTEDKYFFDLEQERKKQLQKQEGVPLQANQLGSDAPKKKSKWKVNTHWVP